jgi:hypothetical protein
VPEGTTKRFSLLPGEKVLLESDDKTLTLTSHRVRYDTQRADSGEIISIMLDELASCAMVRRSKPILLLVAAACLLLGLSLSIFLIGGVVFALILVAAYFATRQQMLELTSAGAAIRVNAASMSAQTVRSFINRAEAAKHARYLVGRTAAT